MASTTRDTGDTSSKQQRAQCKQKKKTRVRGRFHQSITAILTEEKEKQLLILHKLQSTCFATKIKTGADSKDDSGSQGQYRE